MRALALTAALVLAACTTPTPAPVGEPADSVIALERSVCFGFCPAYRVEVHMDGRVIWEGSRFVGTVGHAEARIDPAAAQALAKKFRDARFFHLKDRYEAQVTDMPYHTLSFTVHGRTKTVVDYAGHLAGMPETVSQLEAAVDATAGTERWITGADTSHR